MSKFLLTITNKEIAAQIAELLNAGGQLIFNKSDLSIIGNSIKYVVEMVYDKVVGVVGLQIMTPQITEIKHLCVHPDYRRKGIGLKLLKKGLDYSTTTLVYGTVGLDNDVNIRNNFRLGFKPVAKYYSRGRCIIVFAIRRNNVSNTRQ